MFNFLKKTRMGRDRKKKASHRDIEVVHVDQWHITFRSRALWPIRETLVLNMQRAGHGETEQAAFEVYLESSRVLTADSNEYKGKVRHAPPQVAQWFAPAADGVPAVSKDPPLTVSELRRGRRAVRTFQVVSKDLRTFKALCGDISATGMRIMADEQLDIGRELELDLDFDDFRFPKVRFRCEVVWCRARDGRRFWVGLRFLDVQAEERKLLETYIGLVDGSKSQLRMGLADR